MAAAFAVMFLAAVLLYSEIDLSRATSHPAPNPGHNSETVGGGTFFDNNTAFTFPENIIANKDIIANNNISLGGELRSTWPSFTTPTLKIEQVIGYLTYPLNDSKVGELSRLNTTESFNNVMEAALVSPKADKGETPFNSSVEDRLYKGLRCKTGWYIVGCGYINTVSVGGGDGDWDHGVIQNGCFAGDGELGSTMEGGITAACMRMTLN